MAAAAQIQLAVVGRGRFPPRQLLGIRSAIIRPELVPRIGGDLLECRSGRLGSLTLADQQPHQAALGHGAGGEASAGSDGPCLGLTVVNVLFNDERAQDVGVEQDGGHLIVLERADVFGGDYPTQPHDGQSRRGAVRQHWRLRIMMHSRRHLDAVSGA